MLKGIHWKESLKILKLVVSRSSSLVAPPMPSHPSHWEPHPSFNDSEMFNKKELPGDKYINNYYFYNCQLLFILFYIVTIVFIVVSSIMHTFPFILLIQLSTIILLRNTLMTNEIFNKLPQVIKRESEDRYFPPKELLFNFGLFGGLHYFKLNYYSILFLF